MPILKNSRHERFSQLVAKGDLSAEKAYVQCGYSKNGAVGAASKLQSIAKVGARIAELKQSAAKKFEMTREEYQQILRDRFQKLDPTLPVSAKYGEMLAKSIGWNEPDRLTLEGNIDVLVRIGGNAKVDA